MLTITETEREEWRRRVDSCECHGSCSCAANLILDQRTYHLANQAKRGLNVTAAVFEAALPFWIIALKGLDLEPAH